MKPPIALDAVSMEERASTARSFLNDPIFQDIMDVLKEDVIQELCSIPPGTSQAMASHATLRGIAAVKDLLEKFIEDPKTSRALNRKRKQ